MIRDDRQRSAGRKPIAKLRQRALESGKLIVHSDAHRLKETRKIAGAGSRPEHRANRPDQIVTRLEWPRVPATDNFVGEPRTAGLVAERLEDSRERALGFGVEQRRRVGARFSPHSHIQTSARAKCEAAVVVVDLVRGHSEIEKDSVERDSL